MSIYHSLLIHPATNPDDKRIRHLENICKELRKYHPARLAKRNKIKRLLWDYESLLESIQIKLNKRSV